MDWNLASCKEFKLWILKEIGKCDVMFARRIVMLRSWDIVRDSEIGLWGMRGRIRSGVDRGEDDLEIWGDVVYLTSGI